MRQPAAVVFHLERQDALGLRQAHPGGRRARVAAGVAERFLDDPVDVDGDVQRVWHTLEARLVVQEPLAVVIGWLLSFGLYA